MIKITNIKVMFLLTIILLTNFSLYAAIFKLNENMLQKQIDLNPPTIKKLQSLSLQALHAKESFNNNFEAVGEFKSYYKSTNEKKLSPFVPVTSPVKKAEILATKTFKQGLKIGVGSYIGEQTNSMLYRGTVTGVKVTLQADLFKNFLGKLTKEQEAALLNIQKKSSISYEIGKKAFTQNIRKIYWALIANNESIMLTKNLLRTAKRQRANAKKRLKQSVGDRGIVARYDSLVSSRRANITYLNYLKDGLIKQLKELLPAIKNEEIDLAKYNLDQTLTRVLECTALIQNQKDIPLNFTKYDELLNISKRHYEAKRAITDTYDSPEFNLSTGYNLIGKDYSSSAAFDNLKNDKRRSFEVGIQLSIPIGNSKSKSKEIEHSFQRKTYNAEREEINGKLYAYHYQLLKSINLLNQIMSEQIINGKHLSTVLFVSNKKYKQARISVRDLINDQDAFMQNELNGINTKLEIINTMLSYFSVFTETPCSFNRI